MTRPALPNDIDVFSPAIYADEPRLYREFARLRREMPLAWVDREPYRPFWSVVRSADIKAIEKDHEAFINAPRLTLLPKRIEAITLEMYGSRTAGVRAIIDMDEPDHRKYREVASRWFIGAGLRELLPRIDQLAERFIGEMAAKGGECDFATDIAVWYPLYVIASMLGVPESEAPYILRMTQELLAAQDPDLQRSDQYGADTYVEFTEYLGRLLADRRAHPGEDLASVIANAQIDGASMAMVEALSYYLIAITAGHDTTSAAISGGLYGFMHNPAEMDRLRRQPELLRSASNEICRWITPVKHFMRTATRDFELHGQTIRAGESVALFFPSGNRDETAFPDPDAFRIDRNTEGHVAFGYGVHACVGRQLALAEMDAFFGKLIPRLTHLEPAGEARLIQSNVVGGYKNLPIRYRFAGNA